MVETHAASTSAPRIDITQGRKVGEERLEKNPTTLIWPPSLSSSQARVAFPAVASSTGAR
jgi:hypothetical protein